jgi:predicted phage-related endonuclease
MGATTQVNIGDKPAITWKERAWGGLDFERLKAELPKIYKEYSRKGSSRVFTLKNFGWKE